MPDTVSLCSTYKSVNIVAYHILIVDKQVVVAISTIPIFFAEACRHISIFAWFAPLRTVISAEIETAGGEFLFIFHCLPKEPHFCCPTVFFNGGKTDALTVDGCSCRDVVLVKGLFRVCHSDFP